MSARYTSAKQALSKAYSAYLWAGFRYRVFLLDDQGFVQALTSWKDAQSAFGRALECEIFPLRCVPATNQPVNHV